MAVGSKDLATTEPDAMTDEALASELDKAKQELETAIAKDPNLVTCYLRLAGLCLQDDITKAETYVETAKRRAPTDANVLSAEIEIAFFKGDVEAALAASDKVRQDVWDVHLVRAHMNANN